MALARCRHWPVQAAAGGALKPCPLPCAGPHTDWGALTILATDGERGLQICLGQEWIEVEPRPGHFVVNLGDMVDRWAPFVMPLSSAGRHTRDAQHASSCSCHNGATGTSWGSNVHLSELRAVGAR